MKYTHYSPNARVVIVEGDTETFRRMVPETTWKWFCSPEAEPVLEKIRSQKNVVHY